MSAHELRGELRRKSESLLAATSAQSVHHRSVVAVSLSSFSVFLAEQAELERAFGRAEASEALALLAVVVSNEALEESQELEAGV